MPTFSRILTITVVALAILAFLAVAYAQLQVVKNSYDSAIEISFHRSPAAFDYSCGESDYQIYFVIKNTGSKAVTGLSVSVSNPLCVGAVPQLPTILNASSEISFYVQSSAQNGTLTFSGNNTLVTARF